MDLKDRKNLLANAINISPDAPSRALRPMGFPSRSLGTRGKPPTCPLPCRLNDCPGPEDLTINAVIDGILGG